MTEPRTARAARDTPPRAFKAPIDIVPNMAKNDGTQPVFRVYSSAVEVGAGWIRTGESLARIRRDCAFADPACGFKKRDANLGRAAGRDDDGVFAVIRNPED